MLGRVKVSLRNREANERQPAGTKSARPIERERFAVGDDIWAFVVGLECYVTLIIEELAARSGEMRRKDGESAHTMIDRFQASP